MFSAPVIILIALAYLGLLFAIARYGDRCADAGRSIIATPTVYALSIAVYCTSWTFFGSVGRAVSSGVGFLPIYLGPTLTFILGWLVIRKIVRISKQSRITSIADFIASRYGKSVGLGMIVSLIALIGIPPYISLQLKAISASLAILLTPPGEAVSVSPAGSSIFQDIEAYVALAMTAFAILFGTRHIDASERHEGLVAAIAFESIVKLAAFLLVGLFVTYGLYGGFADIFGRAEAAGNLARLFVIDGLGAHVSWVALTVLAMAAIIVLPRQFQVVVVENVDERHLQKAMWLFPLYLLLINVFVLPIAIAGLLRFPGGEANADMFVVSLPLQGGAPVIALIAFIGGLSAATGMIIVETVALATMVSNDLVMPLLLRMGRLHLSERKDLTGILLAIRRSTIALVLVLGYIYASTVGESYALVTIGLVSFVACLQFAPPILAGIYWKGASRLGAVSGLLGGFAVWAYTLLLPSFARSGWISQVLIEHGPFGIDLLKPYALLGLAGLDPIAHATFWTLLVNVGLLVGVSLFGEQSLIERSQAVQFVDVFRTSAASGREWRGNATVADLRTLLARFLGQDRAVAALARFENEAGRRLTPLEQAGGDLVAFAERNLAGAIGAASARIMIASVLREEMHSIDEVTRILDEASQVVVYSRELEEKSAALEAATEELRRANERLQELDKLKDDFMATVSHEIRTPLTSIRSFSEILRDNPELEPAERHEFVSIIVSESERLSRLINDILDLSKMEAGKTEWSFEIVEPGPLIGQAVAGVSGLVAKSGTIELTTDIEPDLGTIRVDRDRLTQVVVNLLSNAMKFADATNGVIRVRAMRRAGKLRVEVSDNGAGIAPADQERIFERFQQAGNTLTDKPQGTGLGLPICRQILHQFGGTIGVESKPGRGATFWFEIALHAGGGEVARHKPSAVA